MLHKEQRDVLIIGGPTASGKSGLALDIAQKKNGVVINADSLQIYRGLPLLTAQPSENDLQTAPHRLYAVLAPDEVCNAATWRTLALTAIDDTLHENKLPIVVGGTGFYIKTLLEGISPIPEIDPVIRAELVQKQKEMGNPAFHAAFEKIDPVMAKKLDPLNTQRVMRAWEVLIGTGKSLAEWQALPREKPPAHLRMIVISLLPEREKLYQQCNGRFKKMIADGALDEVRSFQHEGSPLTHALGFQELSAHLSGQLSLEDAVEQAQQSTRHYAKRQMTWFRHQIKAELTPAASDAGSVIELLN